MEEQPKLHLSNNNCTAVQLPANYFLNINNIINSNNPVINKSINNSVTDNNKILNNSKLNTMNNIFNIIQNNNVEINNQEKNNKVAEKNPSNNFLSHPIFDAIGRTSSRTKMIVICNKGVLTIKKRTIFTTLMNLKKEEIGDNGNNNNDCVGDEIPVSYNVNTTLLQIYQLASNGVNDDYYSISNSINNYSYSVVNRVNFTYNFDDTGNDDNIENNNNHNDNNNVNNNNSNNNSNTSKRKRMSDVNECATKKLKLNNKNSNNNNNNDNIDINNNYI